MKRINRTTVEFTPGEVAVKQDFDNLLDEGKGITHAALLATSRRLVGRTTRWTTPFSREFITYLSDGTLMVRRLSDSRREVLATSEEAVAHLAEQGITLGKF